MSNDIITVTDRDFEEQVLRSETEERGRVIGARAKEYVVRILLGDLAA